MRKKSGKIIWDEYWIKNNPSEEAINEELDRLVEIQQKEYNMNNSITNSSLIKRQSKINILRNALWKQPTKIK